MLDCYSTITIAILKIACFFPSNVILTFVSTEFGQALLPKENCLDFLALPVLAFSHVPFTNDGQLRSTESYCLGYHERKTETRGIPGTAMNVK